MDKADCRIVVREMREEDVEGVLLVENRSFTIPWSGRMFLDELNNPLVLYFVATYDATVVGYAGIWIIADEGHITNIAVDPSWRRQQIATALIQKITNIAAGNKLRGLTLEVRAGNTPAISLYKGFGFRVEGRRKAYYRDTQEDALVMWCYLENLQSRG